MSLGVSRTLSVCVGVGGGGVGCLSGSNSCTPTNFPPSPEVLLYLQTSIKDLDCDQEKGSPIIEK